VGMLSPHTSLRESYPVNTSDFQIWMSGFKWECSGNTQTCRMAVTAVQVCKDGPLKMDYCPQITGGEVQGRRAP
jgi:hypothetical protein